MIGPEDGRSTVDDGKERGHGSRLVSGPLLLSSELATERQSDGAIVPPKLGRYLQGLGVCDDGILGLAQRGIAIPTPFLFRDAGHPRTLLECHFTTTTLQIGRELCGADLPSVLAVELLEFGDDVSP